MHKPLKGQPQALGARSKTTPRLIRRVWLYGATDGGATTARSVSTPVPAGATYVDARAIGAGGGWGGGGGGGGGAAYARAGAPVSPGSSVVASVGCQSHTVTDGAPSQVAVAGVTIVLAEGGKTGSPGAGGSAANSIGNTRRSGNAGDDTYGGASGSDAADPDPLGIGGERRRDPIADGRVNDGTVHPMPADFGSGGGLTSNFTPASAKDNSGSYSWTGDGHLGGPGVVVLEFWSKKPG